jgi:ApaG protein
MAQNQISEVTKNIRVTVSPRYSAEHSNLEIGVFVYLYTILIQNEGEETVQLMSRHWVINDALNQTEQVMGEGVVGQKPIIQPGESFTYTSSCPLKTPTGSMKGTYYMRSSKNENFSVLIPEFQLKDKNLLN